ncbi:MAG: alpha/beta hydrolase family protein [Acidimicrobiia bacterium]
MDDSIISNGLKLAAHFARPATSSRAPGLVLCHGFPQPPLGSSAAGRTYPQLADRIARDCGWSVLTFTFRGAGTSEGNFSIDGWLADVATAVDVLAGRDDVSDVWIAGSSLGGALALCHAATDARVRGVATIGAPASLRGWAKEGRAFLDFSREIGLIHDAAFPPDPDLWVKELHALDPIAAAAKIPPRPYLILHGADDEVVPVADARALAAAAEGSAELRVVPRAGHRLRHDPRGVALLLGWLEQQA